MYGNGKSIEIDQAEGDPKNLIITKDLQAKEGRREGREMWRVWLFGLTVCTVMSSLLLALHYSQTLHSPNYCGMTYMSPSYRPIPVHSPWSYKYQVRVIFFHSFPSLL